MKNLRGPGWFFLLGRNLGNGTQLGFPRLEFYLSGANKRQQMGQGAYEMSKDVVKIMSHGDQIKTSK